MPLTEAQLQRNIEARAIQLGNHEKAAAASQAKRAALIEARIRELIDQAPPLTIEQREKLCALMRGGQ